MVKFINILMNTFIVVWLATAANDIISIFRFGFSDTYLTSSLIALGMAGIDYFYKTLFNKMRRGGDTDENK